MTSLLLALVVIAGLIAALPVAALADDAPTVTLGSLALTNGAAVWFGSYNDSAIQWRVLGDGNDGGDNSKLLLSEYILADTKFNAGSGKDNTWQGSDAQAWCQTFPGSAFSDDENTALIRTSKKDVVNGSVTSELKKEYVFFLSEEEVNTYLNTKRPISRMLRPPRGGGCGRPTRTTIT